MNIIRMFLLMFLLLCVADASAQTSNIEGTKSVHPKVGRTNDKEPYLPEVPRISAESAYLKYKHSSIILFASMDPQNFATQHILGSINFPNDGERDLERVRRTNFPFPKDKEIIGYCD